MSESDTPLIHSDHPLHHWDRTCPACIAETSGGPPNLARELAQAQARIEELEKDAARYKWLRVYPHKFFPEEENLDEEELDAAIDAALRQEPDQEPNDSTSKG